MDKVVFYRPNYPKIETISRAIIYATGFSSEEEIEECVEKGLDGKGVELVEPSKELKVCSPFLSDDSGYLIKTNNRIRYIWCDLNGKRLYEPIPYRVDIINTDSILTTAEQDMSLSLHNHISVSMHHSMVDRCKDPMGLIQRIHSAIEDFADYRERVQIVFVDHTANIPLMQQLHSMYYKYMTKMKTEPKFYIGFKGLKGNILDLKYTRFQEGKIILSDLAMIGTEVVL